MKVINSVSRIMNYVAITLLLLMMLLTVSDIIMRSVFNSPLKGTVEFTEMIMGCLVLGFAWCAVQARHVTVDLVMKRFSPRVQAIVDSVTLFAGMAMCVILTWQGFLQSVWELEVGNVASYTVRWPTFPGWLIYSVGCAMLCLVMVTLVIQKVKRAIKG